MYQSFLGRLQTGSLKLVDVTAPEFGAVGDGCVDDTAAIQRAVMYAVEHAPAVLFLPRGTYLVQDPTTASVPSTHTANSRASALRIRWDGL